MNRHHHFRRGMEKARMNRSQRVQRTGLMGFLLGLLALTGSSAAFADITYVHPDHLGSPIAYTDAMGNVIGREYYTPYGESLNPPTTDDTVSFTGHVRDGDTGLLYMQARYYDPEIGRFLSVDPVTFAPDQPQQFNRYWYANGNPIGNVDPNGEASVTASFNVEATKTACAGGDNAACGRMSNLSKVQSAVGSYDERISSMSEHPGQQSWQANSERTTVVYDPNGDGIETIGAIAEQKELSDGTSAITVSDAAISVDNVDTSLAPAYRTVTSSGGAKILAGNGNALKAVVAHEMGHGNDPNPAKLESTADEHIKDVFPEVLR